MKGLLKKDLALLANIGKIYVGVSLFCMVLGLVNEDMRDFSLSFLVIMFSLAAPSTLSYDEFDNGMPWLMTLSADRSVYAKEKYLLSILLGLTGAVVAVILGALVFRINPFQGGSDSQIAILVAFFFTSGLMLAVMIPAKLKFGSEKSRIIAMGMVIVVWIVFFAGKHMLESFGVSFSGAMESLEKVPNGAVVLTLFIFYGICMSASYFCSVRILEKKEF